MEEGHELDGAYHDEVSDLRSTARSECKPARRDFESFWRGRWTDDGSGLGGGLAEVCQLSFSNPTWSQVTANS